MGAKDSKPSFISYEDAARRVSDSELRRIREAFKRCASGNGATLSLEAFVNEVLCGGVPQEVAEWLFAACGGTRRGIAFRDLLCGIVVLTKGSIDEKIKFLWTLYVNNQHENGMYIYKWDFARTLHLENSSLPITNAPKTAEILTGLFGAGDKVTYEQFRSWLLMHRDATVLSKWLLSDRNYSSAQDLETPTFYQSLAGVTHLEERDIIELEKCFWSLRNAAPTGQLDAASLSPLLSPPLPAAAVPGLFLAFDENRDGHVDFKELCCGLSAACRGPKTERLKFCFKIFDRDRDGVLNQQELADMVAVLCHVANEAQRDQSRASTPDSRDSPEKLFDPDVTIAHLKEKLVHAPRHHKPVFQLGPTLEDSIEVDKVTVDSDSVIEVPVESDSEVSGAVLALEDFLIWSVESAEELLGPFLEVLVGVCHVVLGLRPQCRHQERDIVLGWLRRSLARGMAVGQFWYLVCAQWWAAWGAHTAAPDACCPAGDPPVDDSFTTNSTESMGSLLYRCDSASLDSSSSGVSSAGGARAPPPIDNARLLAPSTCKVRTLTGEGGHLRRDVTLCQGRDFELLPDALWRALALWYGGGQPLPRQVIRPPNSDVELELYPLQLKILRHVQSPQTMNNSVVGVGGAALYSSVPLAPAPPQRQLAYTAAFSRLATVGQVCEFLCTTLHLAREDMRLWLVSPSQSVLLDDELTTLQQLTALQEQPAGSTVLLEQRAADRAWPEETGLVSMNPSGAGGARRGTWMAPDLPGATGLHNLGNTCYMNAALQSVWNTGPLTRYFNSGMHLYEVNPRNPLGTRGALALRYGELCKQVWSCRSRSIAPLRVRGAVSRWARGLAGGGQHDAQELLAWLLDQLHEDLNRAAPATGLGGGGGGQEQEEKKDQIAATTAWEQHTARNKSIVTELFYGQLKSKVRCDTCGHESVRFDAFNMLSLPLPLESALHVTVTVILLDGSVPVQYGVRVAAEGTVIDLKRSVAERSGLPPDKMLVVESASATLGRTLDDSTRLRQRAYTLYEVPASTDAGEDTSLLDLDVEQPAPAAEVSAPRSALCMPALFCFKRSRSEILMSQSPPGFYEPRPSHTTANDVRCNTMPEPRPSQALANDVRCNTLPKNLRPGGNCSPTLSVKSLNLRPNSPRLGKAKFGSSPSNMHQLNETKREVAVGEIHYLVAVHRKQCRLDSYFLPSQRCRPALFGAPLLVPVGAGAGGGGRALYAAVWAQVRRLLSPRPPRADTSNHAADCDDSLGYEYPFTLRLVDRGGMWCGRCPWSRLCRGCPIASHPPAGTPLSEKRVSSTASVESDTDSGLPDKHSRQYSSDGCSPCASAISSLDLGLLQALRRRGREPALAVDWDPTALHLRYQTTREKAYIEHSSVRSVAAEAARPIDLDHCLSAFTAEERLEQPYHCDGCRSAQPATKKLQIWRLPPILIVHLKRFQYVNNKWIKSQKVVNFPFEDFDPTAYLASVPQETILRHKELLKRTSTFHEDPISESETDDEPERDGDKQDVKESHVKQNREKRQRDPVETRARKRLESSSLVTTPVMDDNLIDYHQHHLLKGQDAFDLKYRLYAVVSHSGQLSGGHYVAYARNPSGAWLCYNDSSCRELPAPHIDPATAYLLFYERQGLDPDRYLPDVTGKQPVSDPELLDPEDSDLKKMCSVM